MLLRQNINKQINSRFTPAAGSKIGTLVLIPNFTTQKGIYKKLQPLRKGPYQIIDKPTDVKYKLTDSSKKEIVQHRNNLSLYSPTEYALRELTQLYSFTGLKIVQNNSDIEHDQNTDKHMISKRTKEKELVQKSFPKPETKNLKKREKIGK